MRLKCMIRQRRLFDQLLSSFGIFLLLGGFATLGINYRLFQAQLEAEIQAQAAATTRSLQLATQRLSELENPTALAQIVHHSATLPAVIEVAILDATGKALVHTARSSKTQIYTSIDPKLKALIEQARQSGTATHRQLNLHDQAVWVQIQPFESKLFHQTHNWGMAIAILDLQPIHQQFWQMFLISTLAMLVIILMILIAMGWLVQRSLLVPLNHLTIAVANSQNTGSFSLQNFAFNSEFRTLAMAFESALQERQQIERLLQQRAHQLRNHNVILNRLAKHRAISYGDLPVAIKEITEATAETLLVERVSVWLYNQKSTHLECLDLFERPSDQHQAGISLVVQHYPIYCRAIDTEENPIAAHNARTDPRTCEFSDGYLIPLGIESMLDAPIRLSGRTIGVLCIEQVGSSRHWAPEEESFARSISDLIALALEARDRNQAETQVRQQAQALKNTLMELKHTQTQMIQSEKMSSLGQMVAGVAHEINNPVNFIFGNTNYASEYVQELLTVLKLYQRYYPNPAPEIQEQLAVTDLEFLVEDLPKLLASMRVGAERIREIVRSLRIFSRLDEAEFKAANLHEGIDSALMILYHRLKATPDRPEIQIIKEYGEIPYLDCYPGQLNQVFMNILSNAIDALEEYNPQRSGEEMEQHPRWIRIRTGMIGQDWIRIQIADNGTGIQESQRSKLFDPFFTTKPVGKGTGLGLSISYQIVVEKHSGTLQCCSAIGQGAEFTIDLPLWKQDCKIGTVASSQKSRFGSG